MGNTNKNLHRAKKAKNDEFWTQYEDIEKEMAYYTEYFKDKVVYCNCDDPRKSNFVKYFLDNFERLGLKKVIATGYNPNGKGWVCEYEGDPDLKLPEPVGKKPLILSKRYDPEKYPKYDNYDAIDVSRSEDIPIDYDGVMGVPVTFLDKINDCYICEDPQLAEELKKKVKKGKMISSDFLSKCSPTQFEIVGATSCGEKNLPNGWNDLTTAFLDTYYLQIGENRKYKELGGKLPSYFSANGKAVIPYKRILIKFV